MNKNGNLNLRADCRSYKHQIKMANRFLILMSVLTFNKPFTLRELEKKSKIPYGTLKVHMNFLFYVGLVDRQIGMNHRQYFFNRLKPESALSKIAWMYLQEIEDLRPKLIDREKIKIAKEIYKKWE